MKLPLTIIPAMLLVSLGTVGIAQQPNAVTIQSALDAYFKEDYRTAFTKARLLADQDNAFAQRLVSQMFGQGQGTTHDEANCTRYMRMAGEHGDIAAMQDLANRLRNGTGVPKDEAAARKLEESSKATTLTAKAQSDWTEAIRHIRTWAERHRPAAESMLADAYLQGYGVPKDQTEYVNWIRRAANDGDPRSMVMFANLLRVGGPVVEKNSGQAADWYRKAAHAGTTNNDRQWQPYALMMLAGMYMDEDVEVKDFAEMESSLLKAAKELKADWPRSTIGMLYRKIAAEHETGEGKPKDPAAAVKEYSKAIEYGIASAAEDLAKMYEAGDGIPVDFAAAERLYQKYAAMLRKDAIDRPFSAFVLAGLLEDGARGVPQDQKLAALLYISAAERGDSTGWSRASGLYERGDEVPKDLVKAYVYGEASSRYIDKSADEESDRIKKLLTPAQLEQAETLLHLWEKGGRSAMPWVEVGVSPLKHAEESRAPLSDTKARPGGPK